MGAVLSCEGLVKSFGDLKAVDDVGFEVASGETYGLLGPNGAGKTTTISMIVGLLRPDAGAIHVDGVPMSPNALDAKATVGLVPQELAVYPELSARENLRFFGRLHGLGRDVLTQRIEHVLEVIGLRERADDPAKDYSGGMQRRLNIGIGLLHAPRLLVLDEPTVGVDPQSRNAILDSVAELAEEGIAVLYTTHYMQEAERLCDRIGIVDQGKIVAEGTSRQLVAKIGEHDVVRLEVSGDPVVASDACARIDRVSSADTEDSTVVCVVDGAAAALPGLLTAVAAAGVTVTGVEVREPDLEDVFLHLTGRALRD